MLFIFRSVVHSSSEWSWPWILEACIIHCGKTCSMFTVRVCFTNCKNWFHLTFNVNQTGWTCSVLHRCLLIVATKNVNSHSIIHFCFSDFCGFDFVMIVGFGPTFPGFKALADGLQASMLSSCTLLIDVSCFLLALCLLVTLKLVARHCLHKCSRNWM